LRQTLQGCERRHSAYDPAGERDRARNRTLFGTRASADREGDDVRAHRRDRLDVTRAEHTRHRTQEAWSRARSLAQGSLWLSGSVPPCGVAWPPLPVTPPQGPDRGTWFRQPIRRRRRQNAPQPRRPTSPHRRPLAGFCCPSRATGRRHFSATPTRARCTQVPATSAGCCAKDTPRAVPAPTPSLSSARFRTALGLRSSRLVATCTRRAPRWATCRSRSLPRSPASMLLRAAITLSPSTRGGRCCALPIEGAPGSRSAYHLTQVRSWTW